MPVGACRQLVGSSSECPSESVGSLSAACRQPVGSLSGGPVGPCRGVAGACQSLSKHVGAVGACQSLSGPVEEHVGAPQSKFPRGNLLCGKSERHKVNFPGEIYFVALTK